MNSKNVIVFIAVLAVVLIGSAVLGVAVGTSDLRTIGGFLIVTLAVSAFFVLGRNVWVLIPIFAAWEGRISVLPLPFSVANLAVGFTVVCWAILFATRRVHWRFKWSGIDFWILAMLVLLGIGYLRNPVGFAAFANNSNVGARPYFEVAMAVFGYLILANQDPQVKVVRRLPIAVIVANLVIAIGGTIAFFAPQIGIYMFQFYSGFMPNLKALEVGRELSSSIGRASFLRPFALSLSLYLFASKPPFVNILPNHPLRLGGVMTSGILILLSGFRSALGAFGMQFVIGSILWWRGRGLVLCLALALVTIGGVVVVQTVYPLPERLQRPLSFLPGDWDQSVIRSSEESTQWRLDMWTIIVKGDDIENWWIGDGFGFPASELAYYGFLQQTDSISPEQLANYYLMTGDLHSGPLSAIKFVGVIGLVIFLIVQIVIAYRLVKLWGRNSNPKIRTVIGFFAIVAIYSPIKFVFIYGAFQNSLPAVLIAAGILRILENTVKNGAIETESKQDPNAMTATVSHLRPQV